MRKSMSMLMMADKGKERRFEFGYQDRPTNNYRTGYADSRYYDPAETKFRDDRGREHYDNGRYAPMRNEGGNYVENRTRERDNAGRYTAPKNRYDHDVWYNPSSEHPDMATREMDQPRNMIGFERGEMNMGGSEHGQKGYEQGNVIPMAYRTAPQFTPELAKEWTSKMENEDGTKGPHWSFEQAKHIMTERGLSFDPYEFWAVLNAVYSDDAKIAKKHNINTMDYYIDRTVAWLKDKDAVADKAAAYYEYVVKH